MRYGRTTRGYSQQTGPRGGKFYITVSGAKHYGTPPTGSASPAAVAEKFDRQRHAPLQLWTSAVPGIHSLPPQEQGKALERAMALYGQSIGHCISKAGFGPLLSRHPLVNGIHIRDLGNGTNGLYQPPGYLALTPRPGVLRLPHFMPKDGEKTNLHNVIRTKGLSGLKGGKDGDDWRAGTTIHELTHHAAYVLCKKAARGDKARSGSFWNAVHAGQKIDPSRGDARTISVLNRLIDAQKASRSSRSAVSMYGMTNPHEYFAETHLAYVLYKDELKAKRPSDYKLMQDLRRAAGMKA